MVRGGRGGVGALVVSEQKFIDWIRDCDVWGGAESHWNRMRPVELMIMSDTYTTHRSRVPRRSSGRIKGGATTVQDERGCRITFVFILFIIVFKCLPVPASFFPFYELCYSDTNDYS